MMTSLTYLLLINVMMLASMAFLTLMEQKVLGLIQLRLGPNKNGWSGILQPMADGAKLFSKESSFTTMMNPSLFYLSPLLNMVLALLMWFIYPSTNVLFHMNMSLLFFLGLSSLMVYTTMMAGWSSNSKFSLLGAVRSIAQTISYEISMALTLILILMMVNNMNFIGIWNINFMNLILMMPPLFFIWFATSLAETNRAPFDFAEGESELVSGFNTEYGGTEFALIFMAEYLNIIFMSMITSLMFIFSNKNIMWISMQTVIISYLFILIRGSYPRLRYDRLMMITWTSFLPLILSMMLMTLWM